MSKKTETLQANASSRLRLLLEKQGDLEQRLAEARAQIATADLAVAGTSSRMVQVRAEAKGLEEILIGLVPQISAAEKDARAEASQEREIQLLALRGKEADEIQPVIEATIALKKALAGWDAFVLQERAVGGSPFIMVPGQLNFGIQIAFERWRATIPEALGLPRRPTRLENQQADAVTQCQWAVDLWVTADAGGRESANDAMRDGFRRRAKEMLSVVHSSQERVLALGGVPPALPGGLMAAIVGFLEQQTRELARRLIDREETDFVAQSVPGTPGAEQALMNIRERRTP
jgi:hypothetical protein